MQAISGALGKNVSITDHTYELRGWVRSTFATMFGAAREAGISGLYGDIHYQASITIGLLMTWVIGTSIGKMKLQVADSKK